MGLIAQFKAAVHLVARETKEQGKKAALLILHGVVSAIHPGKYFCRHTTCCAEHLRAVRVEEEVEHES